MKRGIRSLFVALCAVFALGATACGDKKPVNTGMVNVYDGGKTFSFSKWQGDELTYTITEENGVVSVDYAKLMSTAKNYPLLSEISCDEPFTYVNFELSGTVDKEVVISMGTDVVYEAMIGEQHVFLSDAPQIHTYKLKNKLAITAVSDIYLNVDPGAFGMAATGKINIHRSWFSNTVPEGSDYKEDANQKNYVFSSGATWSRCNGWFVDTGWTNMKISPTASSGVRVRSTDDKVAAPYASIIQPIEPTSEATEYSFTFTSVNDSVSDLAILLRGGRRAWKESGQYWDYYDAASEVYIVSELEKNEDGTYTVTYDLAAAMATIGENIDDDGLMIVVFIETYGSAQAEGRDGKFELIINSVEY